MKEPKLSGQILEHCSTLNLSRSEYRVLLLWISQSKEFTPSTVWIAKKLNMAQGNVSKALSCLVSKNVLKVDGYKKLKEGLRPVVIYEISESLKSKLEK